MEDPKHMALLFFFDHLMQKNGRRTIHDLSCQFGARGFTQEMRDAVGITQEGLTEFLSAYPSLFTLEGDQVILNGYGEDSKNHLLKLPPSARQRDYEKEAIEFFEAKLHKFGPELQIKSLLGHRSQAAPEVRLVSGRHLKEFAEFLQMQVDNFVVEGDRVRLKNMPEPKNDERDELDDEGRPLAGIKAKQAAVDYLKGVLEQNEDAPIPLDVFYKKFCDRFSHAVRQEVATNPKELLQFLKLNRNIFFIRSNKVSLVKVKPDENGSESGRSSAESSNGDNNNVLFPLTSDNLHRIHLVKALKTAQDIVSNLYNDLDATSGEKFIGIDFKIITLGQAQPSEEFLSMVVVASNSRIAVFDVAHSDSILLESGLKELLENEAVLKVMHDVKRVATILASRYGVNMQNVFDTQVAHSIIQADKFNKSIAELKAISFLNLQRVYYPQSIMYSDVTPRKLSQTPNWSQRPITDELLLLAAEETHTLVTALYRQLSSQLPANHKTLFHQKCKEALVPLPTKPPPSPLIQNHYSFNAAGVPGNGSTIPPLVTPNENGPFNGIYRPPATRRGENANPALRLAGPKPPSLFSAAAGFTASPVSMRKTSAPPYHFNPQIGPMTNLHPSIANHLGLRQPNPLILQNSQNSANFPPPAEAAPAKPKMIDSATQTISTGDITVLNIYYDS
ncbi:3'-5' exonuclease domain-containing protein [Ditylenchus destructor]|uniref:3'-5' exonuclease domain-containing protein n=1 Tax=Ditylenchus destructor TaxID=166010 RepID=A0AAD4R2K6_9BILA|nr:3'-5' exonuclease domain-containing protein [Ditylenchus destructor]